jgi:hypothetical protein
MGALPGVGRLVVFSKVSAHDRRGLRNNPIVAGVGESLNSGE